jgi:hypothetical protein
VKKPDFLSDIFVRPVNEKGEELSTQGLYRWARRWIYELSRRTKKDEDAKRLLINLAAETVRSAEIYSKNDAFNTHARPFLDAMYGKNPTQSNPFCEEWLLAGLMHAEGIKHSWQVRKPDEMARLAITALEIHFGKQWQDAPDVARHFNIKGHIYSTKEGPKTWPEMRAGDKRDHVRKTLRTAARTWERQGSG